jgi:hypothetical protein
MDQPKISFTFAHDQYAPDRSDFSRRVFLKGIGIFCLGFAPFLQACNNLNSRSETMEAIEKTNVTASMMRPPMDIAVPEKTETATFALG